MMTLREYLEATGQTQAAFAEAIGVNQGTISKICAGTIGPSLRTALLIQKKTGGKVPVDALLRKSASAPAA